MLLCTNFYRKEKKGVQSGWWYAACWSAHLNGVYHGGSYSGWDGVAWYAWRGYHYSFKFTEMKLREN